MSEIKDLDTHPEPYVTISDIASYWQVHRATVYRDIAKGALVPHYLPSGHMRIAIKEARNYGKPQD
jgi:predicted DNA-binding transcriptional regulator YafY